MPYRILLNTAPLRLEATYYGVLTARELEQAASEILALAQQNGTMLLLADCTDVEGGHSVFDLFALADWLRVNAPQIREAVVLPTLDLASKNVRFWETTCRNHCLTVSIFNDRQSALEWLHA